MPAPYSVDFRRKVIETYEKGLLTQQEIAETYNIDLSTVKRYLRLYREKGDITPQKGNKGRPLKIKDVGLQTIQEIIRKNPAITLTELSDVYYNKHKERVSISVLSRTCRKLKLVCKKFSIYASEGNREDVKKKDQNI